MSLDPRARVEREKRGPKNVCGMLPIAIGVGGGAFVHLEITDCPNPRRSDVEGWLREKELGAEALATRRHDQQMDVGKRAVGWAKWAAIAAALSILVTAIFGLLQLLRGGG